MCKKIIMLIMISLLMSVSYASKLSHYMNKMEAEEQANAEREWRSDMNFNDFSFRLEKRYIDERGQRCRDYVFRVRSNPYKHGFYTVCDGR